MKKTRFSIPVKRSLWRPSAVRRESPGYGDDLAASKSLWLLIELLGKEQIDETACPHLKNVISYYERFWENEGLRSPFSAKVAVAELPAMRDAGRLEEALFNLEQAIFSVGSLTGTPGLEAAIDIFNEELLKIKGNREFINHLSSVNFGHGDHTFHSIIRINVIRTFQKHLDSFREFREKQNAKTIIHALYEDLRRNYKPEALSNFVLVQIGDYIRKDTENILDARIYYKEALLRPCDSSYLFPALLGPADIQVGGTFERDLGALPHLTQISAKASDYSEKEEATFIAAKVYSELGELGKTISTAKEYLRQDSYRRFRMPCLMIPARNHQDSGQMEEALTTYQKIFVSSFRPTQIYFQAMRSWMELLWTRIKKSKEKSDRQIAYEGGQVHQYDRASD